MKSGFPRSKALSWTVVALGCILAANVVVYLFSSSSTRALVYLKAFAQGSFEERIRDSDDISKEQEEELLADPFVAEKYRSVRAALKKSPDDVSSLLELSGVYLRRWMLVRATKTLERACELEPRNGMVLRQLSDVWYLRGRYPLAKKLAAEAIAVAPGDGQAHTNYAQACFRLGEKQLARAHFLEGIRLEPRNPHTLTTYAYALRSWSPSFMPQSERDFDEALALFRHTVECRPDLPEGWAGVGYHLYLKGDYGGALKSYLEAEKLDPMEHETLEGLVSVYRKLGRRAEADIMDRRLLELRDFD